MKVGNSILLVWGHVVLAVLFALEAAASSRDATVELLRGLETSWPGAHVQVTVVGNEGGPLRIGDELAYRFDSEVQGYLTALHIDTHGAMTLLYPRSNPEEGVIRNGRPVTLPGEQDGFSLEAQPPIGRDLVYAIVTNRPVRRRDLQISSGDIVVSLEPQEAPAFVRRLHAVLDARPAAEIGVAHIVQQIDGRGDVQYRSADIVSFFGERTRSIRPPKLDLQIHFASDSAELDAEGRRNVDEFARALRDPKLASTRFKVAGHTDDRGSETHNVGLSRRRAETVRRYLVDQGGIDASRLDIEAHGENSPLMSEDSDYARRMNRRVEFTPAR